MSPIGRVLVVLNLILSAAFVGWTANALGKAEDYKHQIAELSKSKDESVKAKEDEIRKVQGDLNAVTEEQRQMREKRDAAQADADRLKTQLDEAKRSNDTMQGSLTKIQATLGDYNNSIAQLGQQKDAAIQRANDAERARDAAVQDKDKAVLAKNDAEEATKNATRKIGDLEKQVAGLQEEVSDKDARIAMIINKTGANLTDFVAPPKIDAFVLSVDRGLKLVVINKGKKDNVKEGFTFSVYRGSQFKGQVRIQDVQEGMSSGLILNEKNAITTGDSASTTL